jgi:hypothetical protein
VIPAALFAMGLFFLIAGLLTPESLSRKGPRTFARDRIVRLGLPLLVWTLVIWPFSIRAAHLAAGDDYSFWAQYTTADPLADTGPMWFVEVLLIYSLAYAAWRHRHPRPAARPPVSGWTLVTLAAGISLATVLVRLVFPAASGQFGQSHLWQWPQLIAMFWLGIAAARRGGLDPVPDRIRRACGLAALGGFLAFGVLGATMAATGVDGGALFDLRWHWAPLTLAAIEGPLAVSASVWLLGTAQRRLDRRPRPLGRALARSAYGAFVVQGPVLIAVMIALRPLHVPAEVKAIAAAGLGLAGSFGLAWVVVTRTRAGRIL